MVPGWVDKGGQKMKNFKVTIKTNQENCPLKYGAYAAHAEALCKWNGYKPCTEKNCPLKEKPGCA